jgi:hypothetical protein
MYDLRTDVIEETAVVEERAEGMWEPQFRPEINLLPISERKQSFKETELGFDVEKAKQEAKRCLRCDLEK